MHWSGAPPLPRPSGRQRPLRKASAVATSYRIQSTSPGRAASHRSATLPRHRDANQARRTTPRSLSPKCLAASRVLTHQKPQVTPRSLAPKCIAASRTRGLPGPCSLAPKCLAASPNGTEHEKPRATPRSLAPKCLAASRARGLPGPRSLAPKCLAASHLPLPFLFSLAFSLSLSPLPLLPSTPVPCAVLCATDGAGDAATPQLLTLLLASCSRENPTLPPLFLWRNCPFLYTLAQRRPACQGPPAARSKSSPLNPVMRPRDPSALRCDARAMASLSLCCSCDATFSTRSLPNPETIRGAPALLPPQPRRDPPPSPVPLRTSPTAAAIRADLRNGCSPSPGPAAAA